MGKKIFNIISFILLVGFAAAFVFPVAVVLINSFKAKFSINSSPFTLPLGDEFVGFSNYVTGVKSTGFPTALGWSLFITVFSVAIIILCTSMCAWYIVRVKNAFCEILYYSLVFSMIVPFQMVMFTMSKTANVLHLDNPFGIILIYLGFGAGLSVFMFTGFIKTVPLGIEEAATIDGCSPIQTFMLIVLPILKPTAVTVAILNAMWIWNDYLLPYLVLDSTKYMTIPIHIQYLQGSYGQKDMGAIMALILLSIIPVIIFYLCCQKHIIKGVAAGAVKG